VEKPARLLFLGDIVGDEALTCVENRIPILRKELGLSGWWLTQKTQPVDPA